MAQPEAYIQFKEPFDDKATAFLKSYMDAFAGWISNLNGPLTPVESPLAGLWINRN